MFIQQQQQIVNNGEPFTLDIQIMPVQDKYAFYSTAKLNEEFISYFTNKTFMLYILELRTGVNERAMQVIKNGILQNCQQALQKGLRSFGFIINTEYYPIKNSNLEVIKYILNQYMKVSEEDDYLLTLRKLRHTITNQIFKSHPELQQLDMVFFTSFVQIDHTLGKKKRSYIDLLNKHSNQCKNEVKRINKILKAGTKRYHSHVITFQKEGEQEQNYSLADRELYQFIHVILGQGYCLYIVVFFANVNLFDLKLNINQGNFDNIQNATSLTKLQQAFKQVSAVIIYQSVSLEYKIQLEPGEDEISKIKKIKKEKKRKVIEEQLIDQELDQQQKILNQKIKQKQLAKKQYKYQLLFSNSDLSQFACTTHIYIAKNRIKLQKIKDQTAISVSYSKKKLILEQNKQIKQCKIKSSYRQPKSYEIIGIKVAIFNEQLLQICRILQYQIISFKTIYDGNKKYHTEMQIDEDTQQYIRERIFYIEQQAKQLYNIIFDPKTFIENAHTTQAASRAKRDAFQQYSSLKRRLDVTQQVLMGIYKKQIKTDFIGKISQAVNYWNLKNSLKNKLIRRVNANPRMIDEIYQKIGQIVQKRDYSVLDIQKKQVKDAVGFCIKQNINFATALKKQDCLAVMIQVERPGAAIADPGRIKIRQISPFVISVSNFFKIYHYGISQFGTLDQQKGGSWFRQYAALQKQNYQQMWDYWDLVGKKYTVPALVPLYICDEHWQVAKLLMKPCLAWTATGQPLGYTFSQTQIIPFMLLSFALRKVRQYTYLVQQKQSDMHDGRYKVTQFTLLERCILNYKLLKKRMEQLCWVIQQTCFKIIEDLSLPKFEERLSESVIEKYKTYVFQPIKRTIDIISNNSSFLGQIYCLIKMKILERPKQEQFHQFFKRLVQEQLRRETDGWNQQETQDKFIDKLLNSQVDKMQIPQYEIVDSEYYDKFQMLKKGDHVHKTFLDIKRQELQMMIKKDGKFNDTQRLMLIQYKRLYENKVLWMWYVRFILYQTKQRKSIHKWKSLDLTNSYMLFTMIIQNKKQRKNYKRREAILKFQYVDPFNYVDARNFLQNQFSRVRALKQSKNVRIINAKKYDNAASTFCYSKSLQQCAGTLINFYIGTQALPFYQKLVSGDTFRVQEKLKLLLTGEHLGVYLFQGWKMGKKKMNLLRKKYPYEFMKYQYMF